MAWGAVTNFKDRLKDIIAAYTGAAGGIADNDDNAAHHFNLNNEVQQSKNMANYFKYHEAEILKDIEEYVSGTYRGHYTGDTHEYRNVQTIDLMAARSLASGFCQSNILKYGSRYGLSLIHI